MLVIGVDLAWGEGSEHRVANETGLVATTASGVVVDAGWTRGLDETLRWINGVAGKDTLLCVDAPLLVTNISGQRRCETEVGQRYGRWKVSANSSNLSRPDIAGVRLLERLEAAGWQYHDGRGGPPSDGRHLSEVYPYATLVGADELGYDLARPVYKRRPRAVPPAAFAALRAANCDDLVTRLTALRHAETSFDLASHPTTRTLVDERSPLDARAYKHREDLIDAVLCAWTGLLWIGAGLSRCQVLGADDVASSNRAGMVATIIAPARSEQRRPSPDSRPRKETDEHPAPISGYRGA